MPARNSSSSSLSVFMLDMGWERYGDCLVIRKGDRAILIDGGHPRDFEDRGEGYDSLPAQFAQIFGTDEPFVFDLLVVTHCHSDHIGCLPRLVEDGIISVRTALVADEKLGFGRTAAEDSAQQVDSMVDRVVAALREEARVGASDAELSAFIEDAARLEPTYVEMLKTLASNGQVIRYRGRNDDISALEREFADFGLEVLGPTTEHLLICAEAIRRFSQDAAEELASSSVDSMDWSSEPSLYRSFVARRVSAYSDGAYQEDRPGKGAAINDQSIVLKFSTERRRVLLTGDMQFAKAEVSGLNPHMSALRQSVVAAGPYDVVKLSHHASYNGFDESVLDEMGGPDILWMSGGINDAGHPDAAVLELLRERRQEFSWTRTDKNGLCSVEIADDGEMVLSKGRGRVNDASAPGGDSEGSVSTRATSPTAVREERRPRPSVGIGGGGIRVESHIEVPDDTYQVRVTYDFARRGGDQQRAAPRDRTGITTNPALSRSGAGAKGVAAEPKAQLSKARSAVTLAPGRTLPDLLFVTDSTQLARNIGRAETAQVLEMIRAAGMRVCDVTGRNSYVAVKAALGTAVGVVIVGGYDVVPSQRLDVLTPQQRAAFGGRTDDGDDFIVWSDDVYGDTDGDGEPEIPVSRIPDGLSAEVVFGALAAATATTTSRFGVRNIARPFADAVFDGLPSNQEVLVSQHADPGTIGSGGAGASHIYLMLHGSDVDGTRFWGETRPGGMMFEAFDLSNISAAAGGVILTGCCWGALTVTRRAAAVRGNSSITPRPAGSSIALSFLQVGAQAFVGCTGSHYSPIERPYGYFGGPMHSAFWARLLGGEAPAPALYGAKLDYLRDMPHGQTGLEGVAIEQKILKQFTCLGLGW